jgi:hypothetical protein
VLLPFFIVKLKRVKPSNHGVHGRSSDFRMSIFERFDDSSMAASQYDNQTPISIDHQGRVLRNCIFDYRSVRHLHLRTRSNAEVPLRVSARDWARQPHSRIQP